MSDDAIKEFFATYGTIAAVEQPFDKVTFSNDVLLIQILHDIKYIGVVNDIFISNDGFMSIIITGKK